MALSEADRVRKAGAFDPELADKFYEDHYWPNTFAVPNRLAVDALLRHYAGTGEVPVGTPTTTDMPLGSVASTAGTGTTKPYGQEPLAGLGWLLSRHPL